MNDKWNDGDYQYEWQFDDQDARLADGMLQNRNDSHEEQNWDGYIRQNPGKRFKDFEKWCVAGVRRAIKVPVAVVKQRA